MAESTAQTTPLPRPQDILAEVTAQEGASGAVFAKIERDYINQFRSSSVNAQEEFAHLQGLRDHYRHKGNWSTFLMWVMGSMIGFQSALLGLVGGGVWDFSKYEWLLPVLLVQNLAQVIGLAVFVVKALFKDVKR